MAPRHIEYDFCIGVITLHNTVEAYGIEIGIFSDHTGRPGRSSTLFLKYDIIPVAALNGLHEFAILQMSFKRTSTRGENSGRYSYLLILTDMSGYFTDHIVHLVVIRITVTDKKHLQ